MRGARLYGILDLGYVPAGDAARKLEQLLAGGVEVIQLRAKKLALDEVRTVASKLLPIAQKRGVPFLLNDHAELARDLPVDGVHVGQDDLPVAEVRRLVSRRIVVGKSTHSLAQAVAAEVEGADYIGFGPIFATPTKPDYAPVGLAGIAAVHERVKIPIFCIGGIKRENVAELMAAGACRVVIVSGLLNAPDSADYARHVREQLRSQQLNRSTS